MKTKIILAANDATIGTVSPYSYQVQAKKFIPATAPKQVKWADEYRPSHLTKGQGKGSAPRFYVYFMDGTFQQWLELTEKEWTELTKNPAAVLDLMPAEAGAAPVEAPAAEAPAKAKRVKREAVAA